MIKRIALSERTVEIIALATLSLAVIGLIIYAWSASSRLSKTDSSTKSVPVKSEVSRPVLFENTLASPPKGLPSYTVTEQRALKTAVAFCGEQLKPAGVIRGALPRYEFKGDGVSVSVSMQGGEVCRFERQCSSSQNTRSDTELEEAACAFLFEAGFGTCKSAYISRESDKALLFMLPLHESGALLYPDMIGVYISMETLAPVGMEADDYLINHCERKIEPKLSSNEAMCLISGSLEPHFPRLSVLPGEESERVCWQFSCTAAGGEDLLFFTDANTGELVEVIILS